MMTFSHGGAIVKKAKHRREGGKKAMVERGTMATGIPYELRKKKGKKLQNDVMRLWN